MGVDRILHGSGLWLGEGRRTPVASSADVSRTAQNNRAKAGTWAAAGGNTTAGKGGGGGRGGVEHSEPGHYQAILSCRSLLQCSSFGEGLGA